MKIPGVDTAALAKLTDREQWVLEVIDKLEVFGGKVQGQLEATEALNAKRLADIFSDPADREIAGSLVARFFGSLEKKTTSRVIGPGMVDAPQRRLTRLFNPRSVAVIGASRSADKVGGAVVKNLLDSDFRGKIRPVNPNASEIQGVKCFKSIDKLPKVDVAIIALPAIQVADAVRALAQKGVKNVVVVSAGFKEAGAEGKKLEDELKAIVDKHDLNLVGPNCLGLLTPSMNASFASAAPNRGGIALLSQSGAVVTGMLSDLDQTGFSAVISMGNQAALDVADYIEEMGADPGTMVISAYVESIPDGPAFVEAASRVSQKKPIVVIKGGQSATGQKASTSHTGSLGGAQAAYDAAFSRAGVIAADNQEEFLDLSRLFASGQPLPKSRRMAVITNAGGPAILTTDAADKYGLEFAEFSDKTKAALEKLLPPETGPGNPLDLLGDAKSDRYRAAMRLLMDDPNVDGVICLATPQSMTDSNEIAKTMVGMSGTKPIICSFQGASAMAVPEQILELGGVPNFATSERAARALARSCDYAEIKARPEQRPARASVDATRVQTAKKHLQWHAGGTFGTEVLELLKAHGIGTVEQRYCADLVEAEKAGAEIGYPVVMKINSPDILHKTDVGGVTLDIGSDAELTAAYAAMMASVKAKAPDAKIDGVEIQKMLPKGQDVIVGVVDDAVFGPMMMFGLGGTMVEVLKDCTFELIPLSDDAIDAMIKRIKGYPMLAGARGAKPIDFDALRDVIRRVAHLAEHSGGKIQELDLNPVRVTEDGAWVCDGRAKVDPS